MGFSTGRHFSCYSYLYNCHCTCGYFHGPDGISIFVTKLGGEPRTFLDGVPNVHDALVNNASGFLGRFMHVIMNVVFPYIILERFLANLLRQTLIKLAFRWT